MLVSDVKLQARDYLGNYSTGTQESGALLRAINRSVEYFKRLLGLPSDERIYSFLFSEDQIYYDLPSDFDESIMVGYHDLDLNSPQRQWTYRVYPEILRRTGTARGSSNEFSTTHINGAKQIMMFGTNIMQGTGLESFDNVGTWVAEGDASGLSQDTNQKYSGNASLKFNITNSSGVATLSNSYVNYQLERLFENNGYIKFWAYLTDDNIDDITIKLFSSASDYYTIVATEQDDGTAFSQDEWIKIGFPANDAIITGSPDASAITEVNIEYDLGAGFTSATNFRIDDMFTTFPDNMDLMYYSSIKGTDTTGATNKTMLTEDSDIILLGEVGEDLIDLVARKAALNVYPQLRGDKEFYNVYTSDLKDAVKMYGRIYPRKRTQVATFRTALRR